MNEKERKSCIFTIKTLMNLAYNIHGVMDVVDVDNCKKIIENREFTANALKEIGFSVIDSDANFLFVKSDKISGLDFYLKLKEKGILVRHFTKEKIKDYNRITIVTREQMDAFLNATKKILEE